jgi:dihydroneopterin aldolase
MTLFLASVRDRLEAQIALAVGADIIDLKEPARGALGAVDHATIRTVLRDIAGRAPVSATVGDLPMRPKTVRESVSQVAGLGVDYVKLGIEPDGDPQGCLEGLRGVAAGARLILVLFADRLPDFDAVATASRIGAAGVMLDTAGKGSGSLLDHLGLAALFRFVTAAKAHGLTVGLAGSLRQEHVPALLGLAPDILGFRGALCRGQAREGTLDPAACREVRALIRAPDRLDPGPRAPLPNAAVQALCESMILEKWVPVFRKDHA